MLSGYLKTYPVTILASLIADIAGASPTLSQWLALDYDLVARFGIS